MAYDREFWDRYADGNEARYNREFAVFVRDLAASLRCTSVLEIGCGTGIDLRLFPGTSRVYGLDPNDRALDMARRGCPAGVFGRGVITQMPFGDSSVDLVFTHGLLNYLDDATLERGVAEMYRVAGRYVMNCERFGRDGDPIDGRREFRDMRRRWSGYGARLVSDVDMHEDIDPERSRFTLLRKA